jgi:hypothetical protein
MDLSVTLRDYPDPLVLIPRSASPTATWVSEGLLFIVGQPVEPESCRIVDVDLGHGSLPKIRVMRTVNPVKTYLQTQSTIITDGCIQVSWGAAIEPCLADMIRMIDSFTKESVDPSPPVGWWDKIRLMMHGQNVLTVSGGCELRVHALGSFSPYYNPEQSCGTHGIDICLNNGIKMELGGDPDQGKDVVIECGQLFFSIPSTGANSARTDTKSAGVFARLTGGVCLMIGVTYASQMAVGPRSASQWKRHCDVSLRSPDFCSNDMVLYFNIITKNVE